jgi:hypothetical protein
MKMEKISRNVWNLLGTPRTMGTNPGYQEVTAFPVKMDYWERGNSGWLQNNAALDAKRQNSGQFSHFDKKARSEIIPDPEARPLDHAVKYGLAL